MSATRIARFARIPAGLRVVTVGGATWGGSGKTPLAIASARCLTERGARVALIGHAYGARPGRARVVGEDDDLDVVGDEAIVAARALARSSSRGAFVVVAPSRSEALAFARNRGAEIAVLDGPLDLRPRRADLRLLAVDADAPWGEARGGAGACAPCGDLRAPASSLRAAADLVVPVRGEARIASDLGSLGEAGRFALFTAVARPERIVRALARRGVTAIHAVHAADHARGGGRSIAREILQVTASASASGPFDAWLATEKCALHLRRALGRIGARPRILVLTHGFHVPDSLARLLCTLSDTRRDPFLASRPLRPQSRGGDEAGDAERTAEP